MVFLLLKSLKTEVEEQNFKKNFLVSSAKYFLTVKGVFLYQVVLRIPIL